MSIGAEKAGGAALPPQYGYCSGGFSVCSYDPGEARKGAGSSVEIRHWELGDEGFDGSSYLGSKFSSVCASLGAAAEKSMSGGQKRWRREPSPQYGFM